MHDSGGWHPDLNLHNILIAPTDVPEVVLIDFDRSHRKRLPRAPQADLARLERSARKLDRAGTQLTTADLDTLRAAYAAGAPCM